MYRLKPIHAYKIVESYALISKLCVLTTFPAFAREEWFIQEVEKGVKAADEGRLTDHTDVKAKWEAKRAAQMD